MNVFASLAVFGGRDYIENCKQLVQYILDHGHCVLNKHIVEDDLHELDEGSTPHQIHDQCKQWISEADIIIAEISTPSHGVGIELEYATQLGKPIFSFYLEKEKKNVSKMIMGYKDIKKFSYTSPDDFKKILPEILG